MVAITPGLRAMQLPSPTRHHVTVVAEKIFLTGRGDLALDLSINSSGHVHARLLLKDEFGTIAYGGTVGGPKYVHKIQQTLVVGGAGFIFTDANLNRATDWLVRQGVEVVEI